MKNTNMHLQLQPFKDKPKGPNIFQSFFEPG